MTAHDSPEILDHDISRYFPDLLKFESTAGMEASEIYRQVRPEVERILNAVVREDLSEPSAVANGLTRGFGTFEVESTILQSPATAGGSDKTYSRPYIRAKYIATRNPAN